MVSVTLPTADGILQKYTTAEPRDFPETGGSGFNRIAYAAAHVVPDIKANNDPWVDTQIDWDQTIAFRMHLWGLGLGVAEAMDTAQRGMGLDWATSLELIGRSVRAAKNVPGAVLASGAGTDHLKPSPDLDVQDVSNAYAEQCAAIEKAGGRIILMASRALAACATSPDDYGTVYDRILGQVREPVIIHWLGEMFDPQLGGYWGHGDHYEAMEVCLDVLRRNAAKIDGVKVSLLDKDKEVRMRNGLPDGVRMYTGDDFNYAELIAGNERGFSDALLGIFSAIAPAASAALTALGENDLTKFNEIFAKTIPLSRHIFKSPTRFYKAGIVFMAYLNGHQDHFVMVGGQQSTRSIIHLSQIYRLADKAGLLRNPELAAIRMQRVLAVHGIGD